jgi:hypothetical protein
VTRFTGAEDAGVKWGKLAMAVDPNEWNIETYSTPLEEARRAEDWQDLALDIALVIEFLKKLLTLTADDPTALKAYLTAALITYRRCFNTGVRKSLMESDVEALPSNSNGTHARIRAQANKLAAHSVNPFDQTKVGIMVRDRKDVVGVGSLTARLMGFSGSEIQEWGKLAEDILNNVLKPRISAAGIALNTVAKGMPIIDITKEPILQVTADPLADPDQRRR